MIKMLEELSINAFPSIDTLFYDGWILRFSSGYTKRANSINPLYSSTITITDKINYCEELYRSKSLPIIFKLTSMSAPLNIDYILENNGYAYIEPTSVQTLALPYLVAPNDKKIVMYDSPTEQWIIHYCMLNNIKYQHMETLKFMLKNIFSEKYFISIIENEQPVACGLGVIENSYIGLYNLVVDSTVRGQGYGEALLVNLLNIGYQHGAKNAYLQVNLNNIPALHLYRKLGFKEKYKYWYRAKL